MDCFAAARNEADRPSAHNPYRQHADAADEIRIEALGRPGDLKRRSRFNTSSPQDADLLFGEAVADAAVDAGAEGEMLARLSGAVDDKLIRADRSCPRRGCRCRTTSMTLSPLAILRAGELDGVARGSAHVQHRRSIADDFGNEVRDQFAPRLHTVSNCSGIFPPAPSARRSWNCGVVSLPLTINSPIALR